MNAIAINKRFTKLEEKMMLHEERIEQLRRLHYKEEDV